MPEVILARFLGLPVAAVSAVTNLAAGISPTPLHHEEVLEAGREAAARMGGLLADVIEAMRGRLAAPAASEPVLEAA